VGVALKQMGAEMRRRAAAYDAAKAKGLAASDPDAALYWCCVAATIAWLHHFDRWCDPELDAALEQVAAGLGAAPLRVEPEGDKLVHLTSTTLDGGGHVEVLMLWCGLVGAAVVSTEWDDPARARHKGVIEPPLPVHACPRGLLPTARALWIFDRLVEARPRRLVLHLNPNDVLALAACLLYRRASGAELIFYDHADTYFWLGASLADRLIEYRPVGAAVARRKRGVAAEKISFVPPTSRTRHSAEVARASLGVPEGATVSLTVAAYYKTRPDGHWDYARTISRVLAAHPRHHHLLVGHGPPADEEALREGLPAGRARLLGKRTDVDALLRAADFAVDSFPLMGSLFRLDAMREGRPVIAVSHPAWPLIFDTGAFPEGYPFVASSNEEVERMSAALIRDAGLRAETGARLRAHFEAHFSREAVARALAEALAGRPYAGAPTGPLEYDPARFTNVLNPARVNALGVEVMVASDLGYAPPLGLAGRVNYYAGYAREALKARLGRLRKGKRKVDSSQ
jgi:glycosyltransferase involved in cell wall biosynthesis